MGVIHFLESNVCHGATSSWKESLLVSRIPFYPIFRFVQNESPVPKPLGFESVAPHTRHTFGSKIFIPNFSKVNLTRIFNIVFWFWSLQISLLWSYRLVWGKESKERIRMHSRSVLFISCQTPMSDWLFKPRTNVTHTQWSCGFDDTPRRRSSIGWWKRWARAWSSVRRLIIT